MVFGIDTGADVTVISEQAFNNFSDVSLRLTNETLSGPERQQLRVRGKFNAKVTQNGLSSYQDIFVVKSLFQPLLGWPAIQALNLVHIESNVGKDNASKYRDKFPSLFQGLGKFGEEYSIKMKQDFKPFCLSTPRRVPLPLQNEVIKQLKEMEDTGVISPVTSPTEWCSGMVVVPKKSGKIRICVDYTHLNKFVCRENHILPAVDETLAKLRNAKFFTKLDANCGFWQIPLCEQSKDLTTFITPIGRFRFNRLPFGICSASEHFQRKMHEIVGKIPGVVCHKDDVLIFGKDSNEHDSRVDVVLKKLQTAEVTLNDQCKFAQTTIKFLGHIIDQEGVQLDPEKVSAIHLFEPPKNVKGVRRFLGMANQLAKFLPNLSEIVSPLRKLL